MKKILILVPVYNGADTICSVIRDIQNILQAHRMDGDILVVNDGSTDNTAHVLGTMPVQVIHHDKNIGKGGALKTGFDYALRNGFSVIVIMDADGQHDPAHLPGMIQKLNEQQADIVIGTRERILGTMPLHRIFSNRFTSWLISRRAGCRIPDSQSGYRAIRTAILSTIHLRTNGYETESELLIAAGKQKRKFSFYPIQTIYSGQQSHIRLVRDTWRFIKMYFTI